MALCVAALLLLALTGCSKKAVQWLGTPKSGSVDLSRLAPRNPAWSNVVFYDKMIASLPPVTVGAQWTGSKAASLPAVVSLGETKTDLALAQERTRLDLVKRREITELTQRLSEARQYRLRVEGFAWRREQRAKTNADIQRINAEYTRRVADQTQQVDAQLVTLKLQVDSLEKLTKLWDASKPPSPELVQARADLIVKRRQLDAAVAQQRALFAALSAGHARELEVARKQGAEAVDEIHRQREAEYKAADVAEVEKARARLQGSMDSVLDEVAAAESRSWIEASPPPAKTLAYQWPQPPLGELQADRVTELSRLTAERQRWIDYVYGDTKRAVADIAAVNHWQISYLPSGKKSTDMTAQVATALASKRWRVGGSG